MKKVDSIILGKIVTLDTDKPVVEAMATKDGLIQYLGSREIAMKLKGEDTKVLDYGSAVIYPGFIQKISSIVRSKRLWMHSLLQLL